MGILKTPEGRYHKNGPVQEILWIAQHLKGFYKLNNKQKTDYKMNVKGKYSKCAVIYPPNFGNNN